MRGIVRTWRILAGSALLALVLAPPAEGQSSVTLGPMAGYYLPTGGFDPATVYLVGLPDTPGDLKGGAWGGEAGIEWGGRLGVRVQALTSATRLGRVYTPGGPVGPTSVRILAGSAQLCYALLVDPRGNRIWVSAGPGVIRHGGDAYAAVGAQTDLAGALGLGGRVPLGGAFALTAGVSALFYAYDVAMPAALRLNGDSLQKGTQRDVLFHVGVDWVWR